jgi:hypothetical protein
MSDKTRCNILFSPSIRPSTCHYDLLHSIMICSSKRKQPVFGRGDRLSSKSAYAATGSAGLATSAAGSGSAGAAGVSDQNLDKLCFQGRYYSPATSVFAGSAGSAGTAVSLVARRTRVISVSRKSSDQSYSRAAGSAGAASVVVAAGSSVVVASTGLFSAFLLFPSASS